jgi:hypothetical protein
MLWLGVATVGLSSLTGMLLWEFVPVTMNATAEANRTETIDIPFDEFRTILVRGNPTKSIIEHGGMTLLDEKMVNFQVNLAKDKRPLFNAIMRQSKSTVQATKKLTVEFANANIDATSISLLQDIQITPKAVSVSTSSETEVGDLQLYATTLQAAPNAAATAVRVSVKIVLKKRLGRAFHDYAKEKLQQTAAASVKEQIQAIRVFASH